MPAYFVNPGPTPAELADYQDAVTTAVASGSSIEALFPGEWDAVIAGLALRETDVVADVGAGTGRLEAALLQRQVPFARLFAVEPHPPSAQFLAWWLGKVPGGDRVATTQAQWHDTRLPAGAIDVAILMNTPIFIVEPGEPPQMTQSNQGSLRSLAKAVKPGGRLHVFERTNKLALLGGADECEAIGAALGPYGFVLRTTARLRLDWMGPTYPRHCHAVLERT